MNWDEESLVAHRSYGEDAELQCECFINLVMVVVLRETIQGYADNEEQVEVSLPLLYFN